MSYAAKFTANRFAALAAAESDTKIPATKSIPTVASVDEFPALNSTSKSTVKKTAWNQTEKFADKAREWAKKDKEEQAIWEMYLEEERAKEELHRAHLRYNQPAETVSSLSSRIHTYIDEDAHYYQTKMPSNLEDFRYSYRPPTPPPEDEHCLYRDEPDSDYYSGSED